MSAQFHGCSTPGLSMSVIGALRGAARSEKGLRQAVTFANDARLLLAQMQGGRAPSITCRGPGGLGHFAALASLRTNSKGKVK